MIVFVESNFILEITYLQEQHVSCEGILSLAESDRISLKVPAFSVIEASLSLPQRNDRRQRFRGDFEGARLRSFRDRSHICSFHAS